MSDGQSSLNFEHDGVVMPIFIDGLARTSIRVIVGQNPGTTFIEYEPFIALMRDWLTTEAFANLQRRTESKRISLVSLSVVGIPTEFREQTLDLNVHVPLAQRSIQTLHFSSVPTGLNSALQAETWSGILNASGVHAIDTLEPSNKNVYGDSPNRASFDGALRLGSIVIEGQETFVEGTQYPWVRGDVRSVYDIVPRALRFSVGDLRYPIVGFQTFIPIGGASVSKDFSITPYDLVYPSSHDDLILESPSTVDIAVDGVIIRTLKLPAGRFDLRDLPISSGVAEIEIRIRDEFGHMQIIRKAFISDYDLLAQGRSNFTYNVGLPSSPAGSDRAYDSQHTSAAMFHHYGITDHWTIGASYQGDREHQLLGVENAFGTKIGLLALEGAYSRLHTESDGSDSSGTAARVRYRSLTTAQGFFHANSLSALVEAHSRLFSTVDVTIANNPYIFSTELSLSRPLSKKTHMTFSVGHDFPRDDSPSGDSIALTTTTRLSQSLSLDTTLSRQASLYYNGESRIYVNLSWTEAAFESSTYASLAYDSNQRSLNSAVQLNRKRNLMIASTELQDGAQSADVAYTYQGNRGDIGVREIANATAGAANQGTTEFSFAGGVVFAGSTIALSRPVTNSFAILSSTPDLNDNVIKTTLATPTAEAKVDAFGPGVVSDLIAYNVRLIDIDTRELEEGVTLKTDRFTLLPAYRSGYDLKVEMKSNLIARGILLGAKDEPLELLSGQLCRKSDATCLDFFTNRKGRFMIEDLSPGVWNLILEEGSQTVLTIKPETKGDVELGEIHVQAQPKER